MLRKIELRIEQCESGAGGLHLADVVAPVDDHDDRPRQHGQYNTGGDSDRKPKPRLLRARIGQRNNDEPRDQPERAVQMAQGRQPRKTPGRHCRPQRAIGAHAIDHPQREEPKHGHGNVVAVDPSSIQQQDAGAAVALCRSEEKKNRDGDQPGARLTELCADEDDAASYFAAAVAYCSSVTFASQVVVPKLMATWVSGASGRAPCQ